ncbi:DNA repair protein REV1 [Vigna unguiculata]|uniref:DNA repair protein REV1 n=1 Tax=Vigna unguiculata TaxID=3917 RepID=A0A4D6M623_VIGUN|nr:DNA repair protein REV1 [Vigna unguiculata]
MFAMTLWLGNTAYLYISVAFAQMLKAVMPVAVFVLGVAVGLEVMSCRMLLIMSVISFGVLVASYGEININWVGVVYQMGGVVGEALRLIFMEIFVKRKGLKLNPISVMYYVSPCRQGAICLFLPWIFLEKSKMDEHGPWNFPPILLILNCLCTFALNLSVFLVITHTSALTIRVAGVVKDWVVVLVSAILFADTKLTMINLVGYAIAIAGVAAYNNYKLKNEASRATSNDSDPESSQSQESQPLTNNQTHQLTTEEGNLSGPIRTGHNQHTHTGNTHQSELNSRVPRVHLPSRAQLEGCHSKLNSRNVTCLTPILSSTQGIRSELNSRNTSKPTFKIF